MDKSSWRNLEIDHKHPLAPDLSCRLFTSAGLNHNLVGLPDPLTNTNVAAKINRSKQGNYFNGTNAKLSGAPNRYGFEGWTMVIWAYMYDPSGNWAAIHSDNHGGNDFSFEIVRKSTGQIAFVTREGGSQSTQLSTSAYDNQEVMLVFSKPVGSAGIYNINNGVESGTLPSNYWSASTQEPSFGWYYSDVSSRYLEMDLYQESSYRRVLTVEEINSLYRDRTQFLKPRTMFAFEDLTPAVAAAYPYYATEIKRRKAMNVLLTM